MVVSLRKFIHRGALITVVVMATITMKLVVLMDLVLLMKELVEVSLMKVLVVFGVHECGGVGQVKLPARINHFGCVQGFHVRKIISV